MIKCSIVLYMKSTPNKEHTKMSINDATTTCDITDLQLGDKVEVKVSRRYGEEQEHADAWLGFVQSVDAENDMIYVTYNSPETMTDPTPTCQGIKRLGSNPEGIDPSCSPSGVVLVKSNGDGTARRYRIGNTNTTAIEQAARQVRNAQVSRVTRLAYDVRTVSYAKRDELSRKLVEALGELAI